MAKVTKALQQELEEAGEFEAKKKALRKQQQRSDYISPHCTDEELKDIFGG